MKNIFKGLLLALIAAVILVPFVIPQAHASVDSRPFVTPPPGPGPDKQSGLQAGFQAEYSCDIMAVTGFSGRYVLYDAGPVIEPTVQEFFAVVRVRDQNPDGSLLNSFTHYVVRFTLDCQNLIYEAKIKTQFDQAGGQLSFYYPGGRFRGQAIYALFGSSYRAANAYFNSGIINAYFGDIDKQPLS